MRSPSGDREKCTVTLIPIARMPIRHRLQRGAPAQGEKRVFWPLFEAPALLCEILAVHAVLDRLPHDPCPENHSRQSPATITIIP